MKRTALVVDDKRNWHDLFGMLLEREGYDVHFADNLYVAKQKISRQFFYVAIVDLILDDLNGTQDGLDIAEQFEGLREGTIVFICTGYPTVQSVRVAFRELAVYDYIEKMTFDPRAFCQIVASLPSNVVAPNYIIDPINLVGIPTTDLEMILASEIRFSPPEAPFQIANEDPEKGSRRTRLANLRQVLARRFNEGELHDLCFDLGVSYDDLPGAGKSEKARELTAYLDRRNSIPELVRICQQMRPDISWDSTSDIKVRRLLESLSRPYQPLIGDRQLPSINLVRYKRGKQELSSNTIDIRFWSRFLGRPIVMRLANASLPESFKPQITHAPNADSALQVENIIGRVYVTTEQEIPFSQFDPSLGRSNINSR